MGGSKSAKGGPNPLVDMDRGGSKSAAGTLVGQCFMRLAGGDGRALSGRFCGAVF